MKLMKATLPRLARLARTTSIVVALAVLLALVAGVASLAVAKPTTGGTTTATALLKGVQNTANAVTTLVNSGTGPALSLQVADPDTTPPLETNSTKQVENLNAATVGGKDATQVFPNLYTNSDVKAPGTGLMVVSCDSAGDPALTGSYVLENRDFVTSAFIVGPNYQIDWESIDGTSPPGRATAGVLCADVE